MKRLLISFLVAIACPFLALAQVQTLNQKDSGYRGIWYSNQPSNDEYVYKYSGGLGTYPANHYPFSVYVKAVNKTFFCYGGADAEGTTLLHTVSYFDHNTGMAPKPTVVLDKKTNNAHDNPVLNIDKDGYIWLFSTAHGTNSPSYVHKSVKPYDIETFVKVDVTKLVDGKVVSMDNFSYLQAWYQSNHGFLNLFTHYDRKVIPNQPSKPRRTISYMTSANGINYSEWKDLATIAEGHYQTSGKFGDKIATSFNFHPVKEGENGLNYRTNLYYIQTRDFGKTWQNVKGQNLTIPLKEVQNDALVKDYQSLGLNVYINDLAFDNAGNPIILYITSKGYQAGPANAPYTWNTARYTGTDWEILPVTTSDNNYDMGSLVVDEKGTWLIIGPTATGPQAFNTGGEMVLWTSRNQGKSWKSKKLTENSIYNHSYSRKPVNVHPDFFAFWADGHGRERSISRLYFADKKGNVYQLPTKMETDMVKPTKLKQPKK
ncbi:MAG: BNR-4 repeat-containing protein [Pedobacter sp.]|uniref:BNR-4 repeat-containing protein n=1 Tax=Pedobacter sp. TaxID=1411316 RepID=UPI002807883A|nr:BNR-4 repeat-containing protein [Pedobacter sp.]MDQ8005892.1 BNR-4 repeat-containing protein [Pedobacter sp.]